MRAVLRLLLLSLVLTGHAARAAQPIVVFAAASLKNALDEAAEKYQSDTGLQVKISYGGSLSLARQIEQGAPADIFACADSETMDFAAAKGLIQPNSRFNLLGNRLVVVAGRNAGLTSLPLTPDAFAKALGAGRLATGEVNSVPVGKYAKAALTNLGLWETVEPHLATTDNVRAALVFVARGEAPLGIVYATDAAAEPNVKIVAEFPQTSHAAIVYPLALTAAGKNDDAAKFLDYLRGAAARRIFENQGFEVLN